MFITKQLGGVQPLPDEMECRIRGFTLNKLVKDCALVTHVAQYTCLCSYVCGTYSLEFHVNVYCIRHSSSHDIDHTHLTFPSLF